MDRSPPKYLLRSGAVSDGVSSPPSSFGDAAAELQAALKRCALVERSHFGRVTAGGRDLLGLLHRVSTADLEGLHPGQGRCTVLTTPKGRIVERLFVHRIDAAGILMIGGPESGPRIIEHLDRYTFAEETGLRDVSGRSHLFALVGPLAADALLSIGFDRPAPYQSVVAAFEAGSVDVLGHDGLSAEGYALQVATEQAGALWHRLADAVGGLAGRPAGEEALEGYRVLRGIPAPGAELTADHNPLEAGLREVVSFDKGCYVGQEVIARLNTYEKVSRSIVGLEFPPDVAPPPHGTALFHGGRPIGALSSAVVPPGFRRAYGLGYVKHRLVEPGIELRIGTAQSGISARLVELPFDAQGAP